jgi:NADH-quinone oxidoreductase subunit N
MIYLSTKTVGLLIPEIVLAAVAVAIYVAGAFVPARRIWSWLAAGGVLVAALSLAGQGLSAAASGPLTIDPLAQYIRWLGLMMGLLFILLSSRPASAGQAPEYVGSLLLVVAGLMLASGAAELVLLFVGLELISIPTYVLLYLGRRDASSQEAAMKYFFLSVLSSAILLYGFSFLYGVSGSTELVKIRQALSAAPTATGGWGLLPLLAMVLIFAGLAFKLAVVPFHFYAPDVYQGTTNPNAGLLAVFPKIAGLAVLVRLVLVAMPGLERFGWQMAMPLAVMSMTLGNVVALWQDNLRRLLAYSSIAHAGYMLIGLAVGLASAAGAETSAGLDGVGAALFYLAVYVLATTGTFAALTWLGREEREIENVDDLAGLGRVQPVAALALAVFMFSLAGIPLLAGFWGKLTLFASALSIHERAAGGDPVRVWFIGLAVVGVLNAAVAAAYYLRIVAVMYFRSSLAIPKAQGGPGAWVAMVVCAALVLALGVYPGPLLRDANRASPTAGRPGQVEAHWEGEAPAEPQSRGQGSGFRDQGSAG